MARWENEDVSGLDLPNPINITRIYLDKNGNEIDDPQLAFAKITKSDDKSMYYIKYGRGEIVDPHHVDANFKKNNSYYVFKKVSDKAFASYEKFLKNQKQTTFHYGKKTSNGANIMKKGPLSTKDKKFIDKNPSLDVQVLADKLKRSVGSIEKYLSAKQEPVMMEEKPQQKEAPKENLFARNKDHGVVVMTEAASMASDENRKKSNSSLDSRKYRNVIHKIRED